jgi:uncharacterized protein
MNMADELSKLQELHASGGLSDEEFARAKDALLRAAPPGQPVPPHPCPLSPAAQEQATRQWAMFIHLSQLAGYMAPLVGLILPIVLWQIKKNELPGVDVHGKIVANWIISEILYMVVCIPLAFICIGIPLVIALAVVGIVFPIIGGIKANNGEAWPYPLSIKWLK